MGQTATFDCRVVPLPNADRVADYFLWRQEDLHRNSLNAHCYWALRREGINARKATSMLKNYSPDISLSFEVQRGAHDRNGKAPAEALQWDR